MSGGGPGTDRDDLTPAGGGGTDQCGKTYQAPINSPKPAVLGPLTVGAVLDVEVLTVGTSSSLVVKDGAGSLAGALTFHGYLTVINCILQRGLAYKATIISIAGGAYTVEVAPL